ncbi:MAG: sugar kinase [Dictyoglomaceae bacterium]|nr:sugar kinase [Dictyoglomaceae bacterium]
MIDVVSYGEVMIRITPERFKTFVSSNSWEVEIGGTEANVLVGLSILGLKTEFISFFPDNFLGYKALYEIRKYGVGVERVKMVSEGRMGIYFVELHHKTKGIQVLYDRKNSSFSLTPLDKEDFNYLKKARLIHLTGVTPSLSDICRENIKNICKNKEKDQKLSFDVNYRQKLWSKEECRRFLNEIIPFIDLLFIKKEDFNILFDEEKDEETILFHLQKLYGEDKIYILTKGEEGCSVLFRNEIFSKSAFSTDMVERIGAGDAFVAGFLYGYLIGKNLQESAELGNAMASLKMSVLGDFPSFDGKTLKNYLESLNNDRSVER